MGAEKLSKMVLGAMDRLDLPGELAAGVAKIELAGNRQFFMSRHKGVLSYSTQLVEISAGAMLVRLSGRELQLRAMTEDELRVSGFIEKVELVG